MLNCILDGRSHAVAFDYSDYHNFINQEALARCEFYIKCRHRSTGYGDPRIVRGGYTVTYPRYYLYYLPFRQRGNPRPTLDVLGRFGYTFQGEIRLVPGEHYVEIAEDLSDLREKIRHYFAHEDERARIAAAGRDYFDKYLHAEQLVAYYLRTIIDRLGSGPSRLGEPLVRAPADVQVSSAVARRE